MGSCREGGQESRFHIPFCEVMSRVACLIVLLRLCDDRRELFLSVVLPEWQTTASSNTPPPYLRAGTLADRLEAAFTPLEFSIGEMAMALRGLVPELYGIDVSAGKATDALPGSAAKVAAMTDRVSAGLPAFHPDDALLPE